MERVRIDEDEIPRPAKRVPRKQGEWSYVPRGRRVRGLNRLVLMRALVDEMRFGNDSISKLYAGLLARHLIEIDPEVADNEARLKQLISVM